MIVIVAINGRGMKHDNAWLLSDTTSFVGGISAIFL